MIVVITNKGAGTGGDESRIEKIREAFAVHNTTVEIIEVDGGELTKAASDAIARGAGKVVAAGGDGTVNTVAAAVVGSDIPLGVLPMGTLNHFAKDAKIPLDLAEAAGLILTGSVRRVDVASVNDRIFINNSSIGLYPLMVRDRDKQRSKLKRSKWWAMIKACAAIFKRFPTFGVRMTIDGATKHYHTPAVFVGNNVYKLELFHLGTRDALDRGLLSVYAVRTLTRWRTVALVFSMIFARLEDHALFDTAQVEEMWLETKRHTLDVSLDGEVVRMHTPLHYKIMKHSLNVILLPNA